MRSGTVAGWIASWMAAVGVAGAVALTSGASLAQEPATRSAQHRRHIPRITVAPISRYYRQCDFWLAVEHRPSGDVITPQQHCWWALR